MISIAGMLWINFQYRGEIPQIRYAVIAVLIPLFILILFHLKRLLIDMDILLSTGVPGEILFHSRFLHFQDMLRAIIISADSPAHRVVDSTRADLPKLETGTRARGLIILLDGIIQAPGCAYNRQGSIL